ncbi:6-bladed beta-propeller [Puteibacter caeruleilacunae]|nr:6-bladed beta-propeller [Puteibacter caeruleilacunae]
MTFINPFCFHRNTSKVKDTKKIGRIFRAAIVFMIIVTGCTKEDKQFVVKLEDPENLPTRECVLSDLCTDIEYITLDSSQLIGRIRQIDFSRRNILICNAMGYSLFNNEGKYLNRIGRIGRGPGEYTKYIKDATISPDGKSIFILNLMREILVYDEHGDFLRKHKLPEGMLVHNITTMNDHQLLLSCGSTADQEKYYWVIVDYNGNVLRTKKSFVRLCYKKDAPAGPLPTHILFGGGRTINYYDQYTDTIFEIGEDSHRVRFIIDRGDIGLTPKLYEQGIISKGLERYMWPRGIWETNNYVLFYTSCKTKSYRILLEKSTNKLYRVGDGDYGWGAFQNDFDGGLDFFPRETPMNSIRVRTIDAYELKAHVASEAFKNSTPKYPEKKKALEKLANGLSENDNPVLMLVRLKK